MKLIIMFTIAFFILFSSDLFSGVKDSAAKYEGTTYWGDIFKDYDYLPEPINQMHKLTMLNSFGVVMPDDNKVGIYDFGIQYIYRIPWWSEGAFSWARPEFGLYFKLMPDKYFLKTLGFSVILRFDSPFYWGYNFGLIEGKYKYTDRDYDWDTDKYVSKVIQGEGMGIEFETYIGYDLFFEDWIVTPELKISILPIYSFDNNYHNLFGITKSPIQIGLNIGRLL